VQCYKCYKWRTVPKEEFETLRENFTKDPWFCSRRPDCSCEDDADIEYDSSRIWVLDTPNIPKPPPETERLVIMGGDYTRMDTYYVMPNGKRARCAGDVDKFLDANPAYKSRISASDFDFAPPEVVEETVVSHNFLPLQGCQGQETGEGREALMSAQSDRCSELCPVLCR
jgi:hypothetical protein